MTEKLRHPLSQPYEISFAFKNVMLVNEAILEIPDIDEENFSRLLSGAKTAITQQIKRNTSSFIDQHDHERPRPAIPLRERTILLGRLALLGKHEEVLAPTDYDEAIEQQRFSPSVLQPVYTRHWGAIIATGFRPHVDINIYGVGERYDGTWLSLHTGGRHT